MPSVDCLKCGIGDTDEGEQDCLICKKLSMVEATYAKRKVEERILTIVKASKLLNALRVLRDI